VDDGPISRTRFAHRTLCYTQRIAFLIGFLASL
jgi:hypothetical protein